MLITKADIKALEHFIEDSEKYHFREGSEHEYFAIRPHLLMVLGFDEFVAFTDRTRNSFRQFWYFPELGTRCILRRPSGTWMLLNDIFHSGGEKSLSFINKDVSVEEAFRKGNLRETRVSFDELFAKLYEYVRRAPDRDSRLWTPTLWSPDAQEKQRIALARTATDVLAAVRAETITLDDLTWSQLEEVVAEVLRGLGMEIHRVSQTPQGGRDLLVRGELIPGQEPLELAVEVKHKRVVDRPEVQTALWQNRHYPALLFVTSGRFTAGVIREKQLPENRLRLFLKDGEALGDLIRDYLQVQYRMPSPR